MIYKRAFSIKRVFSIIFFIFSFFMLLFCGFYIFSFLEYFLSIGFSDLSNLRWNIFSSFFPLYGITYGNGQFLAVGAYGGILNSKDGEKWFLVNSRKKIKSICYGNGLFVASVTGENENKKILDKSFSLVSSDGVKWESSPSLDYPINDIIYVNGKFYAACGSGMVATSTNGKNWNFTYTSSVYDLNSLAYGYNYGKFVAVGEYGTIVESDDGISWNYIGELGESLKDITYGKGKFVAVGDNFNIIVSNDGINWQKSKSFFTTSANNGVNLSSVCYSNGKFISVGEYGYIFSSNNGYEWEEVISLADEKLFLNDVKYVVDRFVAVGDKGLMIMSKNGKSWYYQNPVVDTSFYSLAYGKGIFICGGDNQTIITSNDGINWVLQYQSFQDHLRDIIFANNKFVAVGDNLLIISSNDGIRWNKAFSLKDYSKPSSSESLSTTDSLNKILYSDNLFVSVGNAETVFVSSNGENWKLTHYGKRVNNFVKAAYGNGLLIVLTDTNKLGFSNDFQNFVYKNNVQSINDILFANGKFIAVSDKEEIFVLDNVGKSLVDLEFKRLFKWFYKPYSFKYFIVFCDGNFIIPNYGRIDISKDGKNWRRIWVSDSRELNNLVYKNGIFVGVGDTSSSGFITTLYTKIK